MTVPVALSIAGSDPSGGAGIQADLKTFAALGVYGAAAITALTAQNSRGVAAVAAVDPDFVAAQAVAVLSDFRVAAVKLGMLGQRPIVEKVADVLADWPALPVVLDPVMVAKGGAPLLAPAAVQALCARLLPRATVVTPNLPEAAALLGTSEAAVAADREGAGRRLLALGCRAVLLKGGHAAGDRSDDLLLVPAAGGAAATALWLPAPRIQTDHSHGTGCTLSAAIAAYIARGFPLNGAVTAAKRYVHGALAAAASLGVLRDVEPGPPGPPLPPGAIGAVDGKGGRRHGPLDHFWEHRRPAERDEAGDPAATANSEKAAKAAKP